MPFYSNKSIRKIGPLLKSGKVNYWSGNECKKFEKEFSKYLGNKYSLALSNGSVALEIALKAFELMSTAKAFNPFYFFGFSFFKINIFSWNINSRFFKK